MIGRRAWRELVCACFFCRPFASELALLGDWESAFRDREIPPPSTGYCVVCNVQSWNNRCDIRWRHGEYWMVREGFGKWFYPHYPKCSWFRQDVVHASRSSTPSKQESVWCPGGALWGPHSGTEVPRGHWHGPWLATIFSGSEHMWLLFVGLY